MLSDLLTTHAILHVFFLIFAVYIMLKLGSDIAKQRENRVFRHLILAFIVYLTMSGLWTLQEYDVISLPHALFHAICFCSLFSLSVNSFLFFEFTMLRLAPKLVEKRWFRTVSLIPLCLIFACLVASLFNGMVFSTSPDNHISFNWAYPVEPVMAALYMVVILIASFGMALTARVHSRRMQHLTLAASVLFIFVCVVIDDRLDKITILPLAIFAAIFFVFINMQESSIYSDALTGMNNRRKADEYLAAHIPSVSRANPMLLYMADINSFKQINDIHGHGEGDRALILTSDAIKSVVSRHSGFAARYGGDEFIFSVFPEKQAESDANSPETLIDEIQARLTDACVQANRPYAVSISAGYTFCEDPGATPEQCIKRADEMLYTRKAQYHGGTGKRHAA